MDFDYEHHLASLQRTLQLHAGPNDAPPDIDAGPVYEVTLSRAYAVPVTDLWDAVTNPARLGRWFMPVSGVLQTGGTYQLEGNAGGVITLCKPHDIVRLTWEVAGIVSLVNLRFAGQGSSAACLTLTHSRLPDDEHWDQFGPGATGVGWELSFLALAFHLGNPDGPKLNEDAFAASPAGRAFISGSSQAWAQAAIANGSDPAAALAAANRTTAFYTGKEPDPA